MSADGSISWLIDSLDAEASATVTLVATTGDPGEIVNTSTVNSDEGRHRHGTGYDSCHQVRPVYYQDGGQPQPAAGPADGIYHRGDQQRQRDSLQCFSG